MTSRYVVGFDGSSPSEAALSWALQRARRSPGPVLLVHVTDLDDGDTAVGLVEQRVVALEATHPGLEVSGVTLAGSLAWELARFVSPDDLLVLGTHKTGFLHGRVFGSRSVQVAAAVDCSVAVIPEIDLRFRSGVVAGVDRVGSADSIASAASDEAWGRGEELSLVEAAAKGSTAIDSGPLSTATHEARLRHPDLVIRSRMSTRAPAEALLDASRDKALLVLGPGSALPERAPVGSVLHDVLLNVNSPVLVVRPPRRP